MKPVSIIMNVVLIVAIAVLYYLQFTDRKCEANKAKQPIAKAVSKNGSTNSIAYVDLDSLNEKIRFIKDNRKLLESEQQAIELEWENAYRNLEKQKNDFLKRGSSITQQEAEVFQNKLLQQQQEVDTKKQTLTQKLNQKSYKFMDDIQMKLKNFLNEYNKEKVYSYIFTVGNGLDYLVYKDSSMNITQDVIAGMNEILSKDSK